VARLLGIMALDVMRFLGPLTMWTEIFAGRLSGLR
jgi:hypothetical protein